MLNPMLAWQFWIAYFAVGMMLEVRPALQRNEHVVCHQLVADMGLPQELASGVIGLALLLVCTVWPICLARKAWLLAVVVGDVLYHAWDSGFWRCRLWYRANRYYNSDLSKDRYAPFRSEPC